jgi:uncharacterized protein (TIGR02145 family)/uncharacterized repeat protein (TIGR02543 family)
MENTLQNNSKTVANKAAVTKLQKRMAKALLSFCILFSMLMGINMMGYAQSSSQPVTRKTCSIAKGGAAVNFTVVGQLPDNARVSATSVSRTLPNGKQVMGAYDITITKGRSTWQPANGQPVQVTISDPAFADGTPLSVYHEGTNGLEFVANVTATNHTITFPAQSFSVYIVGQTGSTGDEARLKVNFHQVNGNVVTIYVKKLDMTSGTPAGSHFNQIVYDPGTGTLPANTQFRGWIQDVEDYGSTDTAHALNIEEIRNIIKTELTTGVAEGDEIDFYAMAFRSFLITYIDDRNSAVGSHDVLIPMASSETSASYTVDMSYTPHDVEHAFLGWLVNDGGSNIAGHEDGRVYKNDTTIVISGDVVFGVDAPEGHWLVFNENGKGATYNAPQFVQSGQNTVRPILAQDDRMIRNGYTFGGWYTDQACTAGNEFEFGHPITERTEIYAKWIVIATAGYTVVIWTQNITADGYDFKEAISLTGSVGTNISTVTAVNTPGNDNSYARVNGTNKQYTGFHLQNFDQNVEIKPEGNAIVNVYYNRTEYTLTFTTNESTYIYTESVGDNDNNPEKYGYWNGNYHRVYWNNGAFRETNSRWGDVYSGTVYTRTTGYPVYKTITALYEQSIGDNFPITENGASEEWRWQPQDNDLGFNEVLVYIDVMPAGDVTFYRSETNNDTRYMEFWVEALPGQTGTTRTFNGKTFVQYGTRITAKYNWFTEDVDFVNLSGYVKYGSDPAFNTSYNPPRATVSAGGTLRLYYTREVYPINYMDGGYFDGNGNPLAETDRNQLGEVDDIPYQSSVASYNKGGADYFEPTYEGFVFEGWYTDKACTHPYTFTTMPKGGLTLYAKWRQIQYRVFLHPNAGHDLSLDWGTSNQSMSFRIAHGAQVSAPTGLRNGYEFVGWYTDPGFTHTFNADVFVLNETTVTTPYDKTVTMTDSINKWGEYVEPTVNKDLTSNRFWITKKLDLYAKWRATVDGATGIHLQYDVTSCTPGGAPAPNDTRFYQDNVSANAGAAPVSSDLDNYVFSHWQVQRWNGSNYEDVPGDTVLPGAKFQVKKDYAKIEVTHWLDPNNETDTLAYTVTGTASTIDAQRPDATHTKIAKASYTIQLKAVYIPIEKSTPTHITWFMHDGTTDTLRNDDPVEINEAVVIPAAPARTGYNFLGWYKADEDNPMDIAQNVNPNFLWYNKDANTYHSSETFSTDNKADSVAADERTPYDNLFAVWRPITYKVHFNENGTDVTGTMNDQNFVYDVAQHLNNNNFAREGYCFQGWSTTATGSVEYTNQQEVINLTDVDQAVVDLYAVWQEKLTPNFNLADSYCYGETVALSNTSPNGVEGTWSSNGATVTAINTTTVGTATYTFTPNDPTCSQPYSKQVEVKARANAEITATKTEVCAGESTTLSVAEADSYVWSTGATTKEITVTPATTTTYKVTVTAVGGCQTVGEKEIVVNPNPTFSNVTVNDEKCLKKGNIEVTVSGGTADYTYTLNGETQATTSSTSYTFVELEANHDATSYAASGVNYTIEVVDAKGCKATDTKEIKLQPSDLHVDPVNISICSGNSFSFKPSATTDNVLYTWDAPNIGDCLEGGSANTTPKTEITDVLTLKSGCTSGTATYTVHPQLGVCKLNDVVVNVGATMSVRPAVTLSFADLGTVCGNTTQDITLTVNNAVAGSSLTWTFAEGKPYAQTKTTSITTAAATQTFTESFTMPDSCTTSIGLHVDYHDNAAPGEACDANGSYTVNIGIPNWTLPTGKTAEVACASQAVKPADSELPTNVIDGCNTVLYPTYVGVTPADYETSITCTGTVVYTYRYKDCTGTEKDWTYTYNVTGPAKPTITLASGTQATNNLGCNPTSWPTLTADNFVVTDACKSEAKATVTQGEIVSSETSCDRTQIWTATYTNACGVAADQVTVSYNWKATTEPTISTSLANLIEKECNWDGTGAPAASDFTVNTGDLCATSTAATVSGATAVQDGCFKTQVWTASYTNTCGQSASKQVTVKWPFDETNPTIDDIDDQNAVAALNCKYKIPDLSTVAVNAAHDGCSNPTFVSQNPLKDEEYAQTDLQQKIPVVVTVQDACGNTATKTVQVIIPAKMSLTASANPATICINSSSELTATPSNATGAVTYNSWTPSATITGSGATVTATPTAVGTTTYTVSAVDANGCDATATVDVTVSGELELSITPAKQHICNGGAITPITITSSTTDLTVSGLPTGVEKSGSTISGTPTSTTANTYTFTVTANSTTACPAKSVTGTIVVPDPITVSATATPATCANGDGTATVTATGGAGTLKYSYAFKYPAQHPGKDLSTLTTANPDGLDTAVYVVTVTDSVGCSKTAEFTVGVESNFEVSVSSDPVVVCSGGSFSIVPTVIPSTLTGTTYTWGAPEQVPAGSVTGTSAQTSPSDDIHGNNLVNTTDQVATLTYTVQPANGICTATPVQVQVQVSVSFYPQVQITTPDYTVCPNVGNQKLEATFANVMTSTDTVIWQFNGGSQIVHYDSVSTTDNKDNYTVSVPSDNCNTFYTYTVSYKDNHGCKNSQTGKVTVELADNISITGGTNEKTVECVSAAQVKPHELSPSVMPTVTDACGQDISADYTLTGEPEAVECQGDMAYTYTYKDCDNHTKTWTFTYHVVRSTAPHQVGTVPYTSVVECVAAAVAPTTLPKVEDFCGKVLNDPTMVKEELITNCSGSVTYTYTYKDCANKTFEWQYVYQVVPTTPPTVNATGIENKKTVECLADATAPTTIPTATSKCDEALTGVLTSTTDVPNPIACEGTRTYTYTYTDCAGKTATWDYVYTITKKDFTMPSNESTKVACIAQATQPTPPTVTDNCGGTLTVTGPVEDGTYDGCEGTKTYTWTYTDCSGKFSQNWIYTYTIEREDFTAPTPAGTTVACISEAVAPHILTGVMPTVKDNCGNILSPKTPLPTTYTIPTTGGYDGCSGDVTYTYTYEDCEGNSHDWVYTYTISAPAAPTVSGWPSNQTGINSCYAGRPDFPTNDAVKALYTPACDKTMSVTGYEDKNITADNCGWSITREYTLTDGCNTVKNSITYSGSDQTKPEIAVGYATTVSADVNNCVFTYPDLRETIRTYATDNCTDKAQLTITQNPEQNTSITPIATTQTLPVTVTVKDQCNNDSVITINVTVPATMGMTIVDYASLCYGTDDGYIKYSIVGGEPNYTVTLDGPTTKTATQTAAGNYTLDGLKDGTYTLTVKDANGCESTANATIEQIQNTLTITANSNSWTYDGNAHTDNGYTVTFGSESKTSTSGNTVTLDNGDVISGVTIAGSITNVTESPVANVVGTGITITRNATDDVTCFYNLKTVNGQLNITNSTALTLTCEDKSKEYDGSALSYTATPSVTTGTTVSYQIDGESAWSTTPPSITNVSESPMTVNVKAENSNYATANCSYTLTITPKPLTIKVNDTKPYDGTVLVSGLTKATAEGLVSGDALTAGEVTTNEKNVGTYTYSSTATISTPFATTNGISNYDVTYITSQIITKATLTLVSADLSKEYDGIALVNGSTPLATETGWITGEGATYTFTGSQLDKGTSPNSFDIVPNTGTDLNNYQISKTEGTLEVLKNSTEIVLTANSNEKFYDGTPLVDPGYFYNTSLLAATDTIVATVEGSRLHVGTSPNVITEYHVYRGMKGGAKAIVDVTDNYTITKADGTLEVKKQKVTITAASADYTYDGAVHTNPAYSVTGLVSPDAITAVTSGSIQFPNQSPQVNVIDSYTFTTGDPNDYDVETVDGTLTMACTPVTLAITADSYSEKYDGDTHSKNSYQLVVDGGTPINVTGATHTFTNGDVLTVNINGSITHVAESDVTNEITSYTIMHGTTDMMTEGCYTVTTTNGKLTVTCRNITLTSGDASKTYDGTPLSKETVEVTGDGFVSGEGATYSNFNSITNVSENTANNNTFSYAFNTGTTATDYCVTPVYGTLTINPLKNVEVVVTEHSAEYDYDGTAKTVTGYDLTSISSPLYTAADFSFVGPQADSTVTKTEVGHYPMGIVAADFQNNNTNFEDVIFTVVDGFLDIYPEIIIPATYDVIPVTCYGDGDGAVSIPVTGGKPGDPQYTYTVSGPANYTGSTNTPMVLTNLAPGTYSVTISDALGYEKYTSFEITQPDKLVATITVPTSCPNQPTYAVSATVTGGNGGNTYAWSGDATDANAASTTVAMQGTNDCGHEYTVTVNVTDSKNCKATDTKKFTVVDNEDPDFTVPADVTICRAADGSFDASVSITGEPDPTTYSDNCTSTATDFVMTFVNRDTLPTSDLATRILTREWTLTDLCNNSTTKEQKIYINPTVVMDTPADQTICDGEDIAPVTFSTTVTDGTMSYDWTSSNTTTITGLAAAGNGDIPATTLVNTQATAQTTTITVTPTYTNNGKDCVGEPVTFTITVKPSATGMNNLTAYIKCNGDAFTATPTGTKIPTGTQYTWTVTPNTNVTGYSDQTTPVDAPISQNLTNTSNALQTVVYNVTPVTDGCNGETFTISVDVEPTPVLTLNCPADVNKQLNFGECEAEVTPTELGEPTWTHSLGWTAITITNDAPADNMYPEGDNIVTWTMEDECGNKATCQQHVIVTFPPCPDAVDKDGNVYHSVHIDCDCWTVRNLESLTYPDYATNHTTAHPNAGAAIPGVYNYTSSEYPNTNENVTNFGRLYDWPSVVNGGALNDYGHVQGICPDGWYVPTAAQYDALNAHGADALKDSRFWLDGGGSNTTGFSSLPGGYYDGSIQRYLNLMGEDYYWSTTLEGGVPTPSASSMRYNCESLIDADVREGLGYSVRCVKERE